MTMFMLLKWVFVLCVVLFVAWSCVAAIVLLFDAALRSIDKWKE
jgi:hypothetical protein